jgi:hypothetical protein
VSWDRRAAQSTRIGLPGCPPARVGLDGCRARLVRGAECIAAVLEIRETACQGRTGGELVSADEWSTTSVLDTPRTPSAFAPWRRGRILHQSLSGPG